MSKARQLSVSAFAATERVPIEIIHRQAAALAEAPLESELLHSILNYVFVLNSQGQIVFASSNFRDLAPGKTLDQLLGARPGEALSCAYAQEGPGGCGTSKPCQRCGLLQTILHSLSGKNALREFHLTRLIGCQKVTLNLVAMATPWVHEKETYSLLALTYSNNSQARHALRRFFRELGR